MSALGFVTLENAFYFHEYGVSSLLPRMLITLPAHTLMTLPLGYALSGVKSMLLKSDSHETFRRCVLSILGALTVSAALHGFYDIWLSLHQKNIAYAQVIGMGVLGVYLWKKALERGELARILDFHDDSARIFKNELSDN